MHLLQAGKVIPSIVLTVTLVSGLWGVCSVARGKAGTVPFRQKPNFALSPPIVLPPSNTVFSFGAAASICQHQAWVQQVCVSGVCSECYLTHRTPSNLRLLPFCTPSRKDMMKASTAATFLPSSPSVKAFSPLFLRSLPQAVTKIHDSPLKIYRSSQCRLWEGWKRTSEFCGQPEHRMKSGGL